MFFPNRVRLTNSRTGQTIDRTAANHFSSDHRLITDKEEAARFIRGVLHKSHGKRRSFILFPTAEAKIAAAPSSSTDRDEVRRLLTDQGFIKVQIS